MKISLHGCISILLACCFALQAVPSFGQAKATAAAPIVQQVAAQEISKDVVMNRFQQLAEESRTIRLLDNKLKTLRFAPATTPEHYWGKISTYQRIVEGRPEHLISSIYARDYLKPDSKDTAGLAQVTLTSSTGTTKTYSFYLLAPAGDFKKLQEYAVTNNVVTLQHSWWTCVQCQLTSVGVQCGEAALECLTTAVSVVGYLACVGIGCGEAAVAAGACCACNGDWWCSWAVGSCSQSQQCSHNPPNPGVVVPPACERCCEYAPKGGHCTKCISGKEVCP